MFGNEIARREIIGAIGDDVVAVNQVERVRRCQSCVMSLNADVWVESGHHICRAFDLRLADVAGSEDHLPLQVRKRDNIVIDDAERSDSGCGKIEQHRRTEAAGTDDKHACGLEFRLTGAAHLAQYDVAGIAFKFAAIEHCG